jgi:hypothetical protein
MQITLVPWQRSAGVGGRGDEDSTAGEALSNATELLRPGKLPGGGGLYPTKTHTTAVSYR